MIAHHLLQQVTIPYKGVGRLDLLGKLNTFGPAILVSIITMLV